MTFINQNQKIIVKILYVFVMWSLKKYLKWPTTFWGMGKKWLELVLCWRGKGWGKRNHSKMSASKIWCWSWFFFFNNFIFYWILVHLVNFFWRNGAEFFLGGHGLRWPPLVPPLLSKLQFVSKYFPSFILMSPDSVRSDIYIIYKSWRRQVLKVLRLLKTYLLSWVTCSYLWSKYLLYYDGIFILPMSLSHYIYALLVALIVQNFLALRTDYMF